MKSSLLTPQDDITCPPTVVEEKLSPAGSTTTTVVVHVLFAYIRNSSPSMQLHVRPLGCFMIDTTGTMSGPCVDRCTSSSTFFFLYGCALARAGLSLYGTGSPPPAVTRCSSCAPVAVCKRTSATHRIHTNPPAHERARTSLLLFSLCQQDT